ncbi:MAG: hypothetical protein HC852_18145 [Acaryochloridaceae cyanobacterium RU_4_10]|nr:hypothetical protein [Acaryochloridaceae cyanobacterium RU_4_10]
MQLVVRLLELTLGEVGDADAPDHREQHGISRRESDRLLHAANPPRRGRRASRQAGRGS